MMRIQACSAYHTYSFRDGYLFSPPTQAGSFMFSAHLGRSFVLSRLTLVGLLFCLRTCLLYFPLNLKVNVKGFVNILPVFPAWHTPCRVS